MSDPSQVPSKVEFNPKESDSIGINLNSPNVNISMLNWMDSIISSKALKLGMEQSRDFQHSCKNINEERTPVILCWQ